MAAWAGTPSGRRLVPGTNDVGDGDGAGLPSLASTLRPARGDGVPPGSSYHDSDFSWEELAADAEAYAARLAGLAPREIDRFVGDGAARSWESFYRRHAGAFFRPRQFILHAFPQLAPSTAGAGGGSLRNVLEVGSGNGSTVWTLLRKNPSVRVFACDLAPSAVRSLGVHEDFPAAAAAGRLVPFVFDIVNGTVPPPPHTPPLPRKGKKGKGGGGGGVKGKGRGVRDATASKGADAAASVDPVAAVPALPSSTLSSAALSAGADAACAAGDGSGDTGSFQPPGGGAGEELSGSVDAPPAPAVPVPPAADFTVAGAVVDSSAARGVGSPGADSSPPLHPLLTDESLRRPPPEMGVCAHAAPSCSGSAAPGVDSVSEPAAEAAAAGGGGAPAALPAVGGAAGGHSEGFASSPSPSSSPFPPLAPGASQGDTDAALLTSSRGEMDAALLTFVLSALPPAQHLAALRTVRRCLRPGGLLLFRDYADRDLAQLRAPLDRVLTPQLHHRADGTLAYYFRLEEASALMAAAGFRVREARYACVQNVNRAEGLTMRRVWVHAVAEAT